MRGVEFRMKQFERRIWIAACVMCLCYVGTLWVRSGYTFEVAPLSQHLASIPLDLDGWKGTDIPQDERVREMLNAQESLNRVYRSPEGTAVVVSVSAWLRPETVSEAAPHVPKICYTNSGWKILEERDVQVKTAHGELPLTTLLCEKQGERIVVGYWYQMGGSYFTTQTEARRIHRALWGESKWPATVKVLLQTNAAGIDLGLPVIERFIALIQPQISDVPNKVASGK
jgi:EpsI family protein